jgi:hypothetical protein
MTDEAVPAVKSGELGPGVQGEYSQSVEQLLDLLPAGEGENALPRYYAVEWVGEEEPGISDVIILTSAPTGARRQEQWGVFYSAQFLVTEVSSNTGEQQQRFMWCYTGPQRRGRPAEINTRAFAEDYGYEELTPQNIIRVLTGRASSIDDYITLVETMGRRNISPTPELAGNINSLIYQLANSNARNISEAIGIEPDRDRMFALITAYQSLGDEMSRGAQTYLTTQLLKTIALRRLRPMPETIAAADAAAKVLGAALEEGVIPDEPRDIHRVLASSPIYYYEFATNLLQTELERDRGNGTSKSIFGIERLAFVYDYIATILEREGVQLDTDTEHYLKMRYLRERQHDPTQQLYSLLDNMLPDADELPVYTLGGVGQVFKHILLVLHKGEQSEFMNKSVQVVETILAPVVRGKIGKQAVAEGNPDGT